MVETAWELDTIFSRWVLSECIVTSVVFNNCSVSEAMGSRKLGEKSYAFWSHPRASNVQGEKINMNLRHTDGSVQNCDLRQLALQDLPKKFAMCKISMWETNLSNQVIHKYIYWLHDSATSRKIDDTWTMIPGKSKGSGGFIFESGLGKYESTHIKNEYIHSYGWFIYINKLRFL